MSEPTVVDARLDKLEQDNRRLKLTVGALLLALAAVPLIGAVMPEQIPQEITARAFYVEDENGNVRAQMTANSIWIADENWDEDGNNRAWMAPTGINYTGENGTRAVMYGTGIAYFDENENHVWSTICGFEPFPCWQ